MSKKPSAGHKDSYAAARGPQVSDPVADATVTRFSLLWQGDVLDTFRVDGHGLRPEGEAPLAARLNWIVPVTTVGHEVDIAALQKLARTLQAAITELTAGRAAAQRRKRAELLAAVEELQAGLTALAEHEGERSIDLEIVLEDAP